MVKGGTGFRKSIDIKSFYVTNLFDKKRANVGTPLAIP